MKNFILLILLLISFVSFSQEEEFKQETLIEIKEPKKERKVRADHEFSFYATHHHNFGDNFLSQSHKPYVGFGTYKNFINVYGFALGVGYEFSGYKVTDPSMAGNLKRTNYSNFSGRIAYDYKLANEVTLVPYVRIGKTRLKQRHARGGFHRDLGSFQGTSYSLGLNLVYNYSSQAYVFTGLNYNYVLYKVNSNPEYQTFFDTSNQIQIHLGVGFF